MNTLTSKTTRPRGVGQTAAVVSNQFVVSHPAIVQSFRRLSRTSDDQAVTLENMSNPKDKHFPERLEAACKHAGIPYSQSDIGNRLGGVDRRNVDGWMRGSMPRVDMIFRLAEGLGVDPKWLGTGLGKMIGAQQVQRVNQRLGKERRQQDRRVNGGDLN